MGERGVSPFEKPPPHRGPLRRAAKKAALSVGFAAALSDCQPAPTPTPERATIGTPTPETPEINRQELLHELFRDIAEPQDPDFQNLVKGEKGKLARDFQGRLETAAPYLLHVMNIFQEEGVPPQLALLALPESGGDTDAISRRHAVGPFQLTSDTARAYGLTVSTQIDERRDPFLSSRAAAKLLKDLHRRTGSWEMTILAYNSGMALRFDGTWEEYLQHVRQEQHSKHKRTKRSARESLRYLPRFFATRQLMRENEGFLDQLSAPPAVAQSEVHWPETRPQQTYRIKRGDKLFLVARRLKVSLEDLCRWNHIAGPSHIRAGQKLTYFPGRPTTPRPSELAARAHLSPERLAALNPSWSDSLVDRDDPMPLDFSLTLPPELADAPELQMPNSATPDKTRFYQTASINYWENLRTFLAKKPK